MITSDDRNEFEEKGDNFLLYIFFVLLKFFHIKHIPDSHIKNTKF